LGHSFDRLWPKVRGSSPPTRRLVEPLLRDYPLLSVQKAIEILRVSGM
jgi:hypothetical protein